jgi:hypothetical protein
MPKRVAFVSGKAPEASIEAAGTIETSVTFHQTTQHDTRKTFSHPSPQERWISTKEESLL